MKEIQIGLKEFYFSNRILNKYAYSIEVLFKLYWKLNSHTKY